MKVYQKTKLLSKQADSLNVRMSRTYDQNATAWNAVLDGKQGSETVSPIAAPARLTDFAGLAPAYIEVGDLDIFRDEDIAYAQQLARTGVPVELHIHPGAPPWI
jgi:acetyl esterase/lipase